MLVVDASCLFEVVADTPRAPHIAARLRSDQDHAAPEIIDVEVLGVIRSQHLAGRLDRTSAHQAVDDLRAWPGERFAHRWMLDRVWELRDSVRSWDGFYVTLAEALGATLLTLDQRLARAHGPRCEIEVVGHRGPAQAASSPPAD